MWRGKRERDDLCCSSNCLARLRDLRRASGERALGRSIPGSCSWQHHQICLNLACAPENRPSNTRTQSCITPPKGTPRTLFRRTAQSPYYQAASLRDVLTKKGNFMCGILQAKNATSPPHLVFGILNMTELLAATTNSRFYAKGFLSAITCSVSHSQMRL